MALDCSSIGFSEHSGAFMNRQSLGADVASDSLDALDNKTGSPGKSSGLAIRQDQDKTGFMAAAEPNPTYDSAAQVEEADKTVETGLNVSV